MEKNGVFTSVWKIISEFVVEFVVKKRGSEGAADYFRARRTNLEDYFRICRKICRKKRGSEGAADCFRARLSRISTSSKEAVESYPGSVNRPKWLPIDRTRVGFDKFKGRPNHSSGVSL